MAKPKATATKRAGRSAPASKTPEPDGRQRNILALRGTEEFKAWLDGLAARNGAPVTVTIEQALRDLAEKLGYRKGPSRY